MKNVLKIAFLGLVGFGLLVYFTAEKPQAVQANESVLAKATLATLPANYELVGTEKVVSKAELFKAGSKSLLIVGNHDSLAVVKDLKKYYDVKVPFVMVANISSAPWFIKKWAIPGKLEELNQGTNVPMIYDTDGTMVKALSLTDTTKTKYFAYVINESGSIALIHTGNVKEGALDGTMTEDEKKASLEPVIKALN